MPMYSFQCEKCGKRFDEIVSYDRRNQVKCPACSGDAQVLVSSFAVKGGGGSAAGAAPVRSGFS